LKVKLKGLHFADVPEIQESITDELKKVQKEEFSAAFINYTTAQKLIYMLMDLIFSKKKTRVFLMCHRFLKISPKTFGPHCV